MKILLATSNQNKVREIRNIFQGSHLSFVSAREFGDLPEVVEDQDSFAGNATKKATSLAMASGLPALADDSGLEVRALAGRPGVYSARYAGSNCDDEANIDKLLDELRQIDDRRARFCCAIALAHPDGSCETVFGTCDGRISHERAGENGFGYDPVFIPKGYESTFAQLESKIKNEISHRSVALQAARRRWFRP